MTDELAELLAEETGAKPGDVEPRVAANAMIGVHRALIGYGAILAGKRNPALASPRVRAVALLRQADGLRRQGIAGNRADARDFETAGGSGGPLSGGSRPGR